MSETNMFDALSEQLQMGFPARMDRVGVGLPAQPSEKGGVHYVDQYLVPRGSYSRLRLRENEEAAGE